MRIDADQTNQAHSFIFRDLGRLAYDAALAEQIATHERVLAFRDAAAHVTPIQSQNQNPAPSPPTPFGEILFVEHDPVITVTRKSKDAGHVLATAEFLATQGVSLHDTDRGGDVTYHGPGQLVCYPIVDLNRLQLGLHAYMRALESAVIATLAHWNVFATRDQSATGVWIPGPSGTASDGLKICALGVRLREWVSMHGLAINVAPNMAHFNLIVPCGLVGRPVTSMFNLLGFTGQPCPTMADVKAALAIELTRALTTKA